MIYCIQEGDVVDDLVRVKSHKILLSIILILDIYHKTPHN